MKRIVTQPAQQLRRLVLALTLGLGAIASWAQTYIPVYQDIEQRVKERPEEYQALVRRFQEADTTLTREELAVVYYGYAFTPQFVPGQTFPDVLEAMSRDELGTALALADEALRAYPSCLPMLFKAYGLCAVSEEPRIKARTADLQRRIVMLCELIEGSGNGVMPYAPWCVVNEADIIEFLKKYLFIQTVLDSSDVDEQRGVKVRVDGIDDDVILYFDLALQRRAEAAAKGR